jgi:hydroxyacylglutathione hydrolase
MIERLTVGPLAENAYLLGSGTGSLLVDPGDEAPRILSFLDSRGIVPTLVIATHGHLDHTAAIPEVLAAWRGRGIRVPLAVHEADADYFGPKAEETNRRLFSALGALSYFRSFWRPLPAADLLLREGEAVAGGPYVVIHSPGHSPGSACLYDAAAAVLVSGDCLFRDGVGMTQGPDSDPAALQRSLRRLFALPPSTRVLPGHGEETTIGREAC